MNRHISVTKHTIPPTTDFAHDTLFKKILKTTDSISQPHHAPARPLAHSILGTLQYGRDERKCGTHRKTLLECITKV